MEWINIAFNIDGKFVQHCAAVIDSVIRCHKNTERPCRFYIVYDGLSEEQILQMKTLVLGTCIRFILCQLMSVGLINSL